MTHGAITPTASPLASGVQQSSATISSGLASVKLVAADGVTPLLYRTDDTLSVADYSIDANVLPLSLRNARVLASPSTNVSGHGLILALTITSAPNTSETLQMRWYPNINGNGNVVGVSGPFAASLTTGLGTSMQAGGPWSFFLWLYPAPAPTFDNTTFHKWYSVAVPRMWDVEVNPSGASNWTYQVDYGALN